MCKLAVFSKNAPDSAPDHQQSPAPPQQIRTIQPLLHILYRDINDNIIKTQLLFPKIANGSPSVARLIRNNGTVANLELI